MPKATPNHVDRLSFVRRLVFGCIVPVGLWGMVLLIYHSLQSDQPHGGVGLEASAATLDFALKEAAKFFFVYFILTPCVLVSIPAAGLLPWRRWWAALLAGCGGIIIGIASGCTVLCLLWWLSNP